MPFVFGYGRHSTNKQAITEDVQREAVYRYFQNELEPRGDMFWGGWLYDGAESAVQPLTERPKGRELFVIAQPGDHIVWYKMDRAFRSVIDGSKTLQLFKGKGIHVHSLDLRVDTSTPLGKFFRTVLLAVAELELDQLKSRTAEALAELKAQGRPYNSLVPIGYKRIAKTLGRKGTGRIDPCPVERQIVRDIHEWCKTMSHERVYWKLLTMAERGELKGHRKWHKKTVSWALLALAYDFPKVFNFADLKEYARANPTLRDVTVQLPRPLSLRLFGGQAHAQTPTGPA
jgi:DNA invertase Pin-like site-specific DNA recombinase